MTDCAICSVGSAFEGVGFATFAIFTSGIAGMLVAFAWNVVRRKISVAIGISNLMAATTILACSLSALALSRLPFGQQLRFVVIGLAMGILLERGAWLIGSLQIIDLRVRWFDLFDR